VPYRLPADRDGRRGMIYSIFLALILGTMGMVITFFAKSAGIFDTPETAKPFLIFYALFWAVLIAIQIIAGFTIRLLGYLRFRAMFNPSYVGKTIARLNGYKFRKVNHYISNNSGQRSPRKRARLKLRYIINRFRRLILYFINTGIKNFSGIRTAVKVKSVNKGA
jgi:hypothetical protein